MLNRYFRILNRTRRASACAITLAAVSATLLQAESANACTPSPPGPPELVGFPVDGVFASADVVPMYDTHLANMTASASSSKFVLRTGDTAIPLAPEYPYPSVFTLRPPQPLQMGASYVLEATLPARTTGTVTRTVTFTASGFMGPTPPGGLRGPEAAFLQNFHLFGAIDSCDPLPGTCVAIPSGWSVVVTPANALGQEGEGADLWTKSRFRLLNRGTIQGLPADCLTLRGRVMNGWLTNPVLRCASTAPTLIVNAETNLACTSEGITENGRVVPPERGCSMSPSTAGSGAAALTGLLLSFAALRLKRRSKR